MASSSKAIVSDQVPYLEKYLTKKFLISSPDKLEETFTNPDNIENVQKRFMKAIRSEDLDQINGWFEREITKKAAARFWTALRNVEWTKENPTRDRLVKVDVASALREQTGIDDLNEAILSLLKR